MIPRRQVMWHQGLFLQPQHFQMQDLAHQALLAPLYRFALPHFWGVAELKVDEAALSEGVVLLKRGAFLFQDGSYAVLGENAVLPGRVLQGCWQEDTSLTAFVGLARWNERGPNLGQDGDEGCVPSGRYLAAASSEEVCDLYAGGSAAPVCCLDYHLRIYWEWEVPQLPAFHLIPLIRLERSGRGATLSPAFVPPIIAISASPALWALLGEVEGLIAGGAARLRGQLKQDAEEEGGGRRRDLLRIMALSSLNRCRPALQHLLQVRDNHPWQLYGLLCQLSSELSTFSETAVSLRTDTEDPYCARSYDHTDLLGCFAALKVVIANLMEEIVAGPHCVVPLARQGEQYAADLGSALFAGRQRYYLAFRSACDPARLLPALHAAVKVSTLEHLKVLSARALPGIPLLQGSAPPPGSAPGTLYLELDQHSDQWEMVRREENLALYWGDPPPDLEVELVVLKESSRRETNASH